MPPDLSATVLICTRDRQEQLARCLESVIAQDHVPLEIIVVDNGSRNFEVPKLNYPCRTRFFSQPVPGLSYSRNSVIPKAEGDVIALLDDDAIAKPDWLSSALRHFSDPEIGCVTGKVLPFEVKNEWQQRQIATGWAPHSDIAMRYDHNNFDPLITSPGTGTNLMIRKTFFESGNFSELFGPGTPAFAADEHYLFYQIVSAGWRIQYEPQTIVFHDYLDTEEGFRKRILRCTVSRGAYLTRFALLEKGYRLRTWKHLLVKLIPSKRKESELPSALRAEGFLLGPLALMRSAFYARSRYRAGIKNDSLLAEFPGG